ncbi:MAG: hypothetical protein H6569_15705 [Lewinellaceae bacterium]|nr:hypothetical protein [Lewinellaceae bacterium]
MPIQVFKVHHSGSHDLGKTIVKIPDLLVQFQVSVKSHVFISGHVGFQHRKIPLSVNTRNYGPDKTDYAIGIGARLAHKEGNGSDRWINGSKWGPNITSGTEHYIVIPLSGYLLVNPGVHEISFWATAHTDAPGAYSHPAEIMGNSDGSAADPYNQMIVRVEPA